VDDKHPITAAIEKLISVMHYKVSLTAPEKQQHADTLRQIADELKPSKS
jgi:hypothetical protein